MYNLYVRGAKQLSHTSILPLFCLQYNESHIWGTQDETVHHMPWLTSTPVGVKKKILGAVKILRTENQPLQPKRLLDAGWWAASTRTVSMLIACFANTASIIPSSDVHLALRHSG